MIGKLARSIREYKKTSLLTPVFVILEVLVEILIPLIMAGMIDEGISRQDSHTLTTLGAVLLLCVLLGVFFWSCVRKLVCHSICWICAKFKAGYVL